MPAATTPKTYECAACREVLRSQRDLDNHMCLRHDECGDARLGTPITFRCITCGEGFTRRSDLFAHQKKLDHGHPSQWDKARPAGAPKPRRKARNRD